MILPRSIPQHRPVYPASSLGSRLIQVVVLSGPLVILEERLGRE